MHGFCLESEAGLDLIPFVDANSPDLSRCACVSGCAITSLRAYARARACEFECSCSQVQLAEIALLTQVGLRY